MYEQAYSHSAALMGSFSPAMIVVDPLADQLLAANPIACEMLNIDGPLPLATPFSHRLSAGLPLWVSFTDEALVQETAWSDDLVLLDMLRQPYRVEVYAQRLGDSEQLLMTLIDRNKAEQRRAKAGARSPASPRGSGLAACRAGI